MDRTTDETDVVVEEYEEVIGNLDELSDRVEIEDAEAESIQEPTSIDRRNLTTHTGRPSLRSTNARLAGSQEESKPVVVTHTPYHISTKFCMVIKLDDKTIITGRTMRRALAKNFCDTNADARSVCSS